MHIRDGVLLPCSLVFFAESPPQRPETLHDKTSVNLHQDSHWRLPFQPGIQLGSSSTYFLIAVDKVVLDLQGDDSAELMGNRYLPI